MITEGTTSTPLHGTPRPDGGRRRALLLTSAIGGAAVYGAGLVLEVFDAGDVIFFPFVLLLPVIVGAVLGAKGRPATQAAGIFVVAYLADLVHDWIVTGGDQLFHAVLAVLTGAIAALAATVARRARSRADRRSPRGGRDGR
jgi:peptidoglycan/LPS O-acetylase OafA/YrhL